MKRLPKTLEVSANALIIVAAIALCGFVIEHYYSGRSSAGSPKSVAQKPIEPGTKLNLGNLDVELGERNLLMVLSMSCKFCTESTEFYQRLTRKNAEKTPLKIIAAFPQETAVSQKYLDEKGIVADHVIRTAPANLSVSGTPTLIIVDRLGVVEASWVGRLPPDREAEVFSRLFGEM